MNGRIFSVVGAMFLLTVCSRGDQGNAANAAPPAEDTPAPTPGPASTASAAGGTISGKIKFTGTAPRNATVISVMFVGALALATALFLITEMNHPMRGTMKVSSGPIRKALELIGR